MPQPSPASERTRVLRWSGPALLALGVLILAAALVPGVRAGDGLALWIVQETLAPARVLPLIGIGIGIAFGSADARWRLVGVLLAAAGLAIGFRFYALLLEPLWIVPRAAENRFLTGPALALAAGAALVFPMRWRAALLPPCAFIAGVALALGIVAGDPSVDDASYARAGVAIAVWMVLSAALCARAFRGRVLEIGSRIFGSWLVAIGLLYGAAAFAPKRATAPDVPPAAQGAQTTRPPGGEPSPPFAPPAPADGGMLPQ